MTATIRSAGLPVPSGKRGLTRVNSCPIPAALTLVVVLPRPTAPDNSSSFALRSQPVILSGFREDTWSRRDYNTVSRYIVKHDAIRADSDVIPNSDIANDLRTCPDVARRTDARAPGVNRIDQGVRSNGHVLEYDTIRPQTSVPGDEDASRAVRQNRGTFYRRLVPAVPPARLPPPRVESNHSFFQGRPSERWHRSFRFQMPPTIAAMSPLISTGNHSFCACGQIVR